MRCCTRYINCWISATYAGSVFTIFVLFYVHILHVHILLKYLCVTYAMRSTLSSYPLVLALTLSFGLKPNSLVQHNHLDLVVTPILWSMVYF